MAYSFELPFHMQNRWTRDGYGLQRRIPLPPYPPNTYDEFNAALRLNEQSNQGGNLTDSLHTEFQEQIEDFVATVAGVDEYDPPPPPPRSYKEQDSRFSLAALPTNERSFMEWYPSGNATISYPGEGGQYVAITHINLFIIEERCPLLSLAFEPSRSGPQLHLDALGPTTAVPFLRYLYAGAYVLPSGVGTYEDVPTSTLQHCQLFQLGDLYDLPELKLQAYVNVLRQCEFGCSSPNQPIDLCAAIRYTYQYLHTQEKLIDALVNYCVSCFLTHKLAQDEEFRQLAYELRPFHQDLCRNCMSREYDVETATAIIQMPFASYAPETYASREEPANARLDDIIYHFHCDHSADTSPRRRKRIDPIAHPSRPGNITLALRPCAPAMETGAEESSSEDEDYSIVKRRKSNASNATSVSASFAEGDDEVLASPAPVESASSESESDNDTVVEVPRLGVSLDIKVLAIRSRDAADGTADAEPDLDSDWSLV